MPDLTWPLAKLRWAEQHLNALKHDIQRFVDSEPYSFITEPEPEHPHYVVRAYIRAHPPISWGLQIGDIGHNARSALDLLIQQLTTLSAADLDGRRKLQFPIFDYESRQSSRAGYRDKSPRYLTKVSPAYQTIIQRFQPYHRGQDFANDALALLADLNDTDKHRKVNVAGVATEVATKLAGSHVRIGNLNLRGGTIRTAQGDITTPFQFEQVGGGVITHDGAIVGKIEQPLDGPKVDMSPDPEITIKFDEGGPRIQGREVIPTLSFILDRVEEIIGQFN